MHLIDHDIVRLNRHCNQRNQAYKLHHKLVPLLEFKEMDFPFPYLIDETQEVAQAYGAVCTTDFFGYNADLVLEYRGRLDASRKEAASVDVKRDLYDAMHTVATTGQGREKQAFCFCFLIN
jgi:hypothetical protein